MICFKDRTFCYSDCIETKCFRYFGPVQQEAAEAWWGGPDAPVAFSDFSNECKSYTKPNQK